MNECNCKTTFSSYLIVILKHGVLRLNKPKDKQ